MQEKGLTGLRLCSLEKTQGDLIGVHEQVMGACEDEGAGLLRGIQ